MFFFSFSPSFSFLEKKAERKREGMCVFLRYTGGLSVGFYRGF